MSPENPAVPEVPDTVPTPSKRGPGGKQPGAGRKATHGAVIMRKQLRSLTTRKLDGRSALAVAVRMFKADVRRDLGGDLSRAQEVILELAAQSWIVVSTLDDYIARQPTLVNRRKQVLPVVAQRMQFAESLAKQLERLGLERRAQPVPSLAEYLATRERREAVPPPGMPVPAPAPAATGDDGTGEASSADGNV